MPLPTPKLPITIQRVKEAARTSRFYLSAILPPDRSADLSPPILVSLKRLESFDRPDRMLDKSSRKADTMLRDIVR